MIAEARETTAAAYPSFDWKELTKKIAKMHNARGVSAFTLEGEFPGEESYEPALDDADLLRVDGPKITAHQLRRWLWPLRKEQVVREGTSVVWSVYDKEGDASFVGLGQFKAESL